MDKTLVNCLWLSWVLVTSTLLIWLMFQARNYLQPRLPVIRGFVQSELIMRRAKRDMRRAAEKCRDHQWTGW